MTRAFSELSHFLGYSLQGTSQSTALLLWRNSTLLQELKTWRCSQPDEILLPINLTTQPIDLFLMRGIFIEATDARRIELVSNLFHTYTA
jgi:hypothetical protein